MSNQIKCYSKLPYKGMGRSLYGFFRSGNRLIDMGDGKQELRRAAPIDIVVYVDKDTGVFYVDDIKENRWELKGAIVNGYVELDDLELQNTIIENAKKAQTLTIIDEIRKEHIVQKAGTVPKANVYGAGKLDNDAMAKLKRQEDIANAARARIALARAKRGTKPKSESPFISSDTNEYLNAIKEQAKSNPVIENDDELDDETKEFMELLDKEELENASNE
jgi:hypothetical protein